jgi:DnaK suppressor protein
VKKPLKTSSKSAVKKTSTASSAKAKSAAPAKKLSKPTPAKPVKSVTAKAASKGKPVVKKAAPKVATKPVAKVAKTASKATSKPVAKPVVKAKPAAKVASKAPVKAAVKAKAVAKPVQKAAPKAAPKAATKAAPKPSPKAASKPVSKQVAKPAVKPASKPAVKPQPAAKTATKPAAQVVAKPASKPVSTPAAKSNPKAVPLAPVKAEQPAKAAKAVKPAKAEKVTLAPVVAPVTPPVASGDVPARAVRPSARLAQITVPSMAQSVASTAAKASYLQNMPSQVLTPPPFVAVKKDPKLANNWKTKKPDQLSDAEVMAMSDNDYMNDAQMAFFRLKLVVLKQGILANAGETTEHLREDTVVVPDPADRATIEEEHALELRTRDRERKLLKKIEQSIQRIDAGDYGYCDETGEPIGVGRLLARPTANLSLEAQQRRELKQKMFGD